MYRSCLFFVWRPRQIAFLQSSLFKQKNIYTLSKLVWQTLVYVCTHTNNCKSFFSTILRSSSSLFFSKSLTFFTKLTIGIFGSSISFSGCGCRLKKVILKCKYVFVLNYIENDIFYIKRKAVNCAVRIRFIWNTNIANGYHYTIIRQHNEYCKAFVVAVVRK